MIKLPIKDSDTIPWMSKREIVVIKTILSAWREKRRDWKVYGFYSENYDFTQQEAEKNAMEAAYNCEIIANIDEVLRKK